VLGLLLGSAVVAALVSAAVGLITQHWTARLQVAARRRELYAKALEACVAYRELPYAIRRRRKDQPEEERVRLSEILRTIQQQLAFYAAWIESESPYVAVGYRALIQATRRLAGSQMHAAWEAAASHTDAEMNVAGIDYGELVSLETAYLGSVREHLAPLWKHLWRFVTGQQG
jgi:hypothetical protein